MISIIYTKIFLRKCHSNNFFDWYKIPTALDFEKVDTF